MDVVTCCFYLQTINPCLIACMLHVVYLPLHFVTLFTLIQMMSGEGSITQHDVLQTTTVLQEESPVEPTDGNGNVDNEPNTGNIVFTCMCIMSLTGETTAVATADTCSK